MRSIFDHQTNLGLSGCAPEVIYTATEQIGLVNVAKHDHELFENPTKAQAWLLNALSSMLPIMFLRDEKALTEAVAQQRTTDLLREIKALFSLGLAPDGRISTVIGQKAE